MKRIIASLFLVTALVSCKQEKTTPKVIYEEGKSKVENSARDTASFKVADLPILMEGTQYLIHPIGDVRVYDTDSKAYGSSKTNQVAAPRRRRKSVPHRCQPSRRDVGADFP